MSRLMRKTVPNPYKTKHTIVTQKPLIAMLPRLSKNFFLRMVYPELKTRGGSMKSKKKFELKVNELASYSWS